VGSFRPGTPEASLLEQARRRLDRADRAVAATIPVPERSPTATRRASTQAAFGRVLLDLTRVDGVAERLVTVAPDVSTSTNLGGFINKTASGGHDEAPVYDAMEDSPLTWRVGPRGQHIEMGIAEMNLVLLLGQLGLSWDFQREWLFPIGTLYDPFVMRALEGIVYSTYSGSRFVLAGTPSGISLSREGGAHQSISTPGIGIETPGLTYAEPCFARELEWLLLDGLNRLQAPTARRSTCGSRRRRSTRPPSPPPPSDSVRSASEGRPSRAASGSARPARARTAS
jgi:pyruvate dehydrogenase E1 component